MGLSVFPAAASGPTLAEIQTAVSTYSKGPLDITWTHLGIVKPAGTSTTITGLGGYKYIKFIFNGLTCASGGTTLRMRFNADSTNGNYSTNFKSVVTSGQPQFYSYGGGTPNDGIMFATIQTGIQSMNGEVVLRNPTSTTSRKLVEVYTYGTDGTERFIEGTGIWHVTDAITSMNLTSVNNFSITTDASTNSGITVIGGN